MNTETPSSELYQKALGTSAWSTGLSVLLQVSQTILFARLAGPEAGGDYALAAAVISFLTPLSEAGLVHAAVQVNRLDEKQLAALGWMGCGLGAAVWVLLWLAAPYFAAWYGRPELDGLVSLMGISLVFMPFAALYTGVHARRYNFAMNGRIEAFSWLCSFLVLGILAYKGWGAWSMAWAFVVRWVVVSVLSTGFGLAHLNVFRPGPVVHAWPLFKLGFFELGVRWTEFLSGSLDKLILGKWLGVETLGYYNMAFSFLQLPTSRLAPIITRVSFPMLARLKADPAALDALFQKSSRHLMMLLYPLYLTLVLFANEIVLLLLGEAWTPMVPLLQILGVAGWLRALWSPFPALLRALGKPEIWWTNLVLWTFWTNLMLALALWQNPSAEYAAWSRLFAKATLGLLLPVWMAHKAGVSWRTIYRVAFKLGAFGLMCGIFAWYLSDFFSGFWLVAGVKCGVLLLGCLVYYRFFLMRHKV
ncbi:MAG: oligosaccharide flippase family protein [Saprospiraceae bacterium]|nr:oligosaccharide flippase family protein [Saprospiraceae bacterium]